MKLLFVLPSGLIHRHKTGIFKKNLRYAPLTLTYLAALIPKNIEVKLIDESVQNLNLKNEKPDLVGISIMTGTANRGYEIADYFRSQNIPVIIGGVHATLCPKEAKKHADSVVIGSAEKTLPQLLNDYQHNKINDFYINKTFSSTETMPIPRRELLKKNNYITINSMLATRGCVNNCQFCAIPYVWNKKYLKRPIENVIEEIRTMKGREVVFIDVHLLADKQYAIELLKAMIPLKKIWFGLTTTEAINDPYIINLLEKSGCKGLLIGFESVSEEALKSMNKSFNLIKVYESLIKDLHNAGIRINGTFLFGTDFDRKNIFEETVEFVNKTKIDLPRYSVFTPYPGTKVFENLKRKKRIINFNWDYYDVEHVVFKPKNMTPEDLEKGLHWAWEQTYSIKSIFKRINETKAMWPLALLTNMGYRYYAKHLKKFSQFD